MDPFAVFDSPAAGIEIRLKRRTASAGYNVSGILAPETFATGVLIAASLDKPTGLGQGRMGVARDSHPDSGNEMDGEMRLFTSYSPIDMGDRVEVTFLRGTSGRSVKTYRVRGLVLDYSWLEQFTPGTVGRREWSIVLEDPPARPA